MNAKDPFSAFELKYERQKYQLKVEQVSESDMVRLSSVDKRMQVMSFRPEQEITLMLSKYHAGSRFCRDNLISGLSFGTTTSRTTTTGASTRSDQKSASCAMQEINGISYVAPGEDLP